MKNRFSLLIIAILITQSCIAQTYPLNTSPGNIPENAYIKDIDGELDKYVGLWKADWNGKTVYLELKKVKTHNTGESSYYKDRILGERKIVNANGQIEIDRITNFDYVNPEFSGMSYAPKTAPAQRRIHFYPKNMCGFFSAYNITSITATTMTIERKTREKSPVSGPCLHDAYVQQYGEYPVNFPKDIMFTKQ